MRSVRRTIVSVWCVPVHGCRVYLLSVCCCSVYEFELWNVEIFYYCLTVFVLQQQQQHSTYAYAMLCTAATRAFTWWDVKSPSVDKNEYFTERIAEGARGRKRAPGELALPHFTVVISLNATWVNECVYLSMYAPRKTVHLNWKNEGEDAHPHPHITA